jgi:uncharacterized protein (TIGR02145 family)
MLGIREFTEWRNFNQRRHNMKTKLSFPSILSILLIGAVGVQTLISCGGDSGGDDGGDIETVVIGSQTWMKKNLNVASNPGKGESRCYEDYDFFLERDITAEEGCAKYGRLYDWAAAMDLPSKCNSTLSTSDPECAIASPRHKGLCPVGFHVPTGAEWNTVVTAAGGSSMAGWHLQAQSGWGSGCNNGLDTYGFAALPGGFGSSDGYFDYAGRGGQWWSSTEYSANSAYYQGMFCGSSVIGISIDGKDDYLSSVRCLQD